MLAIVVERRQSFSLSSNLANGHDEVISLARTNVYIALFRQISSSVANGEPLECFLSAPRELQIRAQVDRGSFHRYSLVIATALIIKTISPTLSVSNGVNQLDRRLLLSL